MRLRKVSLVNTTVCVLTLVINIQGQKLRAKAHCYRAIRPKELKKTNKKINLSLRTAISDIRLSSSQIIVIITATTTTTTTNCNVVVTRWQ